MNQIMGFLQSRNLKAHTLVFGLVALAGLITADGSFRDLVLKLFHDHPKIGTDVVNLALAVTAYANFIKKGNPPPAP